MSRAEHPTTTRRRVLTGLVPGVLGLTLLAACGAGQITQTDTQESAVNGASGQVGAMAVRDAQLAYPSDSQGVYAPGSNATLVVTIVNTGLTDDTLVKITSPAVTSVTIDGSASGTKLIPGNFAVASGQDLDDSGASAVASGSNPAPTGAGEPGAPTSSSLQPSGSASPSAAPSAPGTVSIVLVGIRSENGASLRPGLTIPLTFYFAKAGPLTLNNVPIGDAADS